MHPTARPAAGLYHWLSKACKSCKRTDVNPVQATQCMPATSLPNATKPCPYAQPAAAARPHYSTVQMLGTALKPSKVPAAHAQSLVAPVSVWHPTRLVYCPPRLYCGLHMAHLHEHALGVPACLLSPGLRELIQRQLQRTQAVRFVQLHTLQTAVASVGNNTQKC